jgi:membrane associated rhomboid family serine protease
MLYDRDYMRSGDRSYLRSPVILLLIVLAAIFLLECFLRVYQGTSLMFWFGLNDTSLRRHQYWRLFTYQFLHDAPWPWHILFNSIALFFFGRAVVETVGTSRFWQIYLGSGLVGGLLEALCQAAHPAYGVGIGSHPYVVGASASVFGLAGAFCFMFPAREVVFFLYVIPIRLRAMVLFWILFGYSAFGTVFPHGGIAHAAHFGGLLAGVGYVRFFLQRDPGAWLRRLAARTPARRTEMPVPAGKAAGRPARSSAPLEEMDTPEEFMRREVDPILDKISAHGIQSLTERERRILERARERMRGR